MTSRPNSIRVMLRLNLNEPRMAKARDILEEGVRQARYKSKSHMIVDALLKTFDGEAVAAPPTMDAIRAALREEMRTARLTVMPPNDTQGAAFDEVARNDAEDDAAVLDFINSLA